MSGIKVFGIKAKEIENGDEFTAKVDFVEGRKVVTLIPKEIAKRIDIFATARIR